MIVLELLHLKMEVTVSEPCDVIRVLHVKVSAQNLPEPLTFQSRQLCSVVKEGELQITILMRHNQAKIIKKSVLLIWLFNMTI